MRIDLLAAAEVGPGEMKMAWVNGVEPVLVVNVAGEYRAFQGICSHESFELDRGFLTASSLTCALHLSRFDSRPVKSSIRRPSGRLRGTWSSSRTGACISRPTVPSRSTNSAQCPKHGQLQPVNDRTLAECSARVSGSPDPGPSGVPLGSDSTRLREWPSA